MSLQGFGGWVCQCVCWTETGEKQATGGSLQAAIITEMRILFMAVK
jgi:hypothetical protein